jgi:hypothetical protein
MLSKKNTRLLSKHNRQILPQTSGFGVKTLVWCCMGTGIWDIPIDDMENADHANIVFVAEKARKIINFRAYNLWGATR